MGLTIATTQPKTPAQRRRAVTIAEMQGVARMVDGVRKHYPNSRCAGGGTDRSESKRNVANYLASATLPAYPFLSDAALPRLRPHFEAALHSQPGLPYSFSSSSVSAAAAVPACPPPLCKRCRACNRAATRASQWLGCSPCRCCLAACPGSPKAQPKRAGQAPPLPVLISTPSARPAGGAARRAGPGTRSAPRCSRH